MRFLKFEDTGSPVMPGLFVTALCTHRIKRGEIIGGYLKIVSKKTVRIEPLSGDIPVIKARFFEDTDAMIAALYAGTEVME